MKRSLFVAAALVASGHASAQSSVTLFGVVDANVSGYRNQSETPAGVKITKSQTVVGSSGYNSSRLGFRGTEDLGGGLAASFWLEAGLNNDTGTGFATGGALSFNRRSTVSLSGVFGEVRLGRDYSPGFWNDSVFDPFNSNGVGTSLVFVANGGSNLGVPGSGFTTNTNYVRSSNSIGYFLPPDLGGLYGQFMYAFNERTSYAPGGTTPPGVAAVVAAPSLALVADNARAGRYIGARMGYVSGALDVAASYSESTTGSNYYAGSTTSLDSWSVGASYDFGVAKVFAEYASSKQDTALAENVFNPFGLTKPGADGGLLGVTVPIGVGLIRASYSVVKYNNVNLNFLSVNPDPKADQFALGYVYNLSKRTALYATAAYLKNKNGSALAVAGSPTSGLPNNSFFYTGTVPGLGGAAVPRESMGYNVGLRHAF
ncbi:porin [Variovorax sp. GT1P44]|uniref:porin n=1 Tax=Variovorax sp. GT1P44 TaxID=3443742 RepID=UPI003F4894F1